MDPAYAQLLDEVKRLREQNAKLERMVSLLTELVTLKHEREDPLEKEFSRMMKKHRKHFLKEKILQLIGQGKPLADVKYQAVDVYGYMSKPSFYRYVKELEEEGKIQRVQVNQTVILQPVPADMLTPSSPLSH